MSNKVKHTKNELKAQREALNRYRRFLPMLQLKKQQLQAEINAVDAKLAENQTEEKRVRDGLNRWVQLFSGGQVPEDLVTLEKIRTADGNIAGVTIPLFEGVDLRKQALDLFDSPPWFDDASEVLEQLIGLRTAREILEEQKKRIIDELRITSQRVNLFEKVKIPECRENIRVIKIFLGDEQTASVVRGKLAKSRTVDIEYAERAIAEVSV